MDYIRDAEKYLENYRRLERAAENLRKQISMLNMGRTTNNLVQNFDVTGIRGSAKSQDAYNQLYQWTQLRANLTETEEAIKDIDFNLKFISSEPGCERYGDLLRMWYIEKAGKEAISEELNYSIPQVYREKSEAVKKFAVQLFGIRAII